MRSVIQNRCLTIWIAFSWRSNVVWFVVMHNSWPNKLLLSSDQFLHIMKHTDFVFACIIYIHQYTASVPHVYFIKFNKFTSLKLWPAIEPHLQSKIYWKEMKMDQAGYWSGDIRWVVINYIWNIFQRLLSTIEPPPFPGTQEGRKIAMVKRSST